MSTNVVASSSARDGAPRRQCRRGQVTLVGSWTFSKQGQAGCAEFIAERKVDVERLFTHRWQLEQAEEAYRLFDTQTTGKAVILPS